MDLQNEKKLAHIHYGASLIGGFVGVFPILTEAKLLGSAQTSNLIEIVLTSLRGDGFGVLWHFLGTFLYALAVFFVTFFKAHSKFDMRVASLFVTFAASVVMWLLPSDLPVAIYLYPTFFSMAFQWTAFPGAYGYASSTIFSTNNLRQCVASWTEVFFNGKKEFALKCKFFALTILFFHIGVVLSAGLHFFVGKISALFVIIPICAEFFIILKSKQSV